MDRNTWTWKEKSACFFLGLTRGQAEITLYQNLILFSCVKILINQRIDGRKVTQILNHYHIIIINCSF